MPRPRRRALGLIGGAGVLVFLGTNVQAGWLFVIAACLLGTCAAGLFLPGRMVRSIEVTRRAPAEVHQLDEVRVTLAVTNRGRGMRLGVMVEDRAFDPVRVAVPSLAPRETAELVTVRRALRRGRQGIEGVRVGSWAPFGVAERRRSVEADAGFGTLVLPAVVPLGSLDFVRPAATAEHAIRSFPRKGHGPDYLGIREYRPGDPPRLVHWSSTARTGTLMVRELEEERTRRLAIVVDAAWDAGETWTPLDRVCAAAASVAMASLAQGHGCRLIVPGAHGLEVLARTDEDALLRRLAELTPSSDGRGFGDALAALGPELRGMEAVVAIFPVRRGIDVAAIAGSLATLRTRVDTVVAIPIEVTAEESAGASSDGVRTMLERDLRTAGAEVHVWGAGEPLERVLSPTGSDGPTEGGSQP